MADDTIPVQRFADWLTRFRDAVVAHRQELTDLDSAIGDADHGINMVRGMEAVASGIADAPPGSVAGLLTSVARALISTVGGASGPLYGTFFLRMGMAAGASEPIGAEGLAALLSAGVDGVVARGRAAPGDKTMIDAMAPAVDAFGRVVSEGGGVREAARAAAEAAARGRDATGPLQARKGRASYLGERSIGHIDPGAASTALLFTALAESLAVG